MVVFLDSKIISPLKLTLKFVDIFSTHPLKERKKKAKIQRVARIMNWEEVLR